MKAFVKGFKKGFRDFGHIIAYVVNFSLLTIVYFLGVGMSALIGRNKSFLDMKLEKEKASYWEELHLKTKKKEEYYKQF